MIGGRTALDYLIKVWDMDFVSAVELFCGERGAVVSMPQTEVPVQSQPKPFLLSEANRCGTAMISYLQGRGINADIISCCIGLGHEGGRL